MVANAFFSRLAARASRTRSAAAPLALAASALLSGLGATGTAQAAPVSTRADLQTLIGGPGTVENFEALTFAAGRQATLFSCDTGDQLNAASTCETINFNSTQGAGLVHAGINITKAAGQQFQWNAAGYFGAGSKEVMAGGGSLGVDFVSAVQAFGVDLRAFAGLGTTIASVDIFAADDTTLLATVGSIALDGSGVPVFIGWESTLGIGRIAISQTGRAWTPIIDNIEWGATIAQPQAAVPTPGTLALASVALVALGGLRKRKPAA